MTKKKIARIIKAELFALVVVVGAIIFKATTDNIFFPKLSIMIPLSIVGLILLGLGIWYNKL